VYQVNEFDRTLAGSAKMKGEAVDHVFEERPEKDAREKGEQRIAGSQLPEHDTEVERIGDQGQIHSPDHKRMCFGQLLQKPIPEQPGLPLVVYFIKFHKSVFICP
jgi:hypothetical protein